MVVVIVVVDVVAVVVDEVDVDEVDVDDVDVDDVDVTVSSLQINFTPLFIWHPSGDDLNVQSLLQ